VRDLKVTDNFLPVAHLTGFFSELLEANWSLGRGSSRLFHKANNRLTITLATEYLEKNHLMLLMIGALKEQLESDVEVLEGYANLYTHETVTTLHTDHWDDDAYTALLFITPHWEDNWGGELMLFSDDKECSGGCVFEPNRLALFPSNVAHRVCGVSSIAEQPRISVTLKVKISEESNA
jgi:Rps23 Pro-64 3,4-dihydroxylase Tpa1-like proline 4-hydroxylase